MCWITTFNVTEKVLLTVLSSWYKAWKAQWLLMGYMVRVKIPNPNSWEGDFISSAHHPFVSNIFRFLTSIFLSCFLPTTYFSVASTTCAKISLLTPGRHGPFFSTNRRRVPDSTTFGMLQEVSGKPQLGTGGVWVADDGGQRDKRRKLLSQGKVERCTENLWLTGKP